MEAGRFQQAAESAWGDMELATALLQHMSNLDGVFHMGARGIIPWR